MKQTKALGIVSGLIGTLIFMDLIASFTGPFGLFGFYEFWNMKIIGLLFIGLGIAFILTRKTGEFAHAKAASGICFFFGIGGLFYDFFVARIILRFGPRGMETLTISQFLLEFGFLFYVMHELFLKVYPTSRVTKFIQEVAMSLIISSVIISAGITLLSF